MKTIKNIVTSVLVLVVALLAGCSSNSEIRKADLAVNSEIYSQVKTVYCGGSDVKSYFESDSMIYVTCTDSTSKSIPKGL